MHRANRLHYYYEIMMIIEYRRKRILQFFSAWRSLRCADLVYVCYCTRFKSIDVWSRNNNSVHCAYINSLPTLQDKMIVKATRLAVRRKSNTQERNKTSSRPKRWSWASHRVINQLVLVFTPQTTTYGGPFYQNATALDLMLWGIRVYLSTSRAKCGAVMTGAEIPISRDDVNVVLGGTHCKIKPSNDIKSREGIKNL